MKRMNIVRITILLVVIGLLCVGCQGTPAATGLWSQALYTEDTTLGQGSTALSVVVAAEGKEITLTVMTDKETVGDALLEHGLIEGEEQEMGLYLQKVNGITADWDTNKAYWAFYEKDAYAMAGVDATPIEEGVLYALVWTAG